MRRKLRFRGKRTRSGFSAYVKGGTKYMYLRRRITWKNYF